MYTVYIVLVALIGVKCRWLGAGVFKEVKNLTLEQQRQKPILHIHEEASKSELDLMRGLLNKYDKRSRPVKTVNKPVIVTVDMYPLMTDKLDEREQTLVTHIWLSLEWKDEYLRWNMTEWGEVRYVTIAAKDIWTPAVVIRNSAGSVHNEVVNSNAEFKVIVSASGTVSMMTTGEVHTSCLVDVTYFPFDDQACYIQIDNWSDGDSRVKLTNRSSKLDLSGYRVGGQWYVTGTEVYRETQSESFESYTSVIFVMYLRRKPLYYVINLVLPSVLLAMLTLLVFFLPPEAGEKMSLGITVLLSFSVLQLIVDEDMPKTSDCIPVAAIYLMITMMMTAVSLLLTVLVLSLHYDWPYKPLPQRWKRTADVLARALYMKTYWNSASSHHFAGIEMNARRPVARNDWRPWAIKDENYTGTVLSEILNHLNYLRMASEEQLSVRRLNHDWVQLARVVDRVLLAIFSTFNLFVAISLLVIFPLTKGNISGVNVEIAPEVIN